MGLTARLRAQWVLVTIAAIVAVLVAVHTLYHLGHGGLTKKQQIYHVATGELLVDLYPSVLGNATSATSQLNGRAELISQYATGTTVVGRIASISGIPASKLTVQSLVASGNSSGGTSSKAIAKVGHGRGHDSILLRSTGQGQTISISTEAHSSKRALLLAHATIAAVRESLKDLQNSEPINRASTTVTTSSSTTTTTTTAANGKKKAKTKAVKPSASSLRAAKHARQVANSKIILRPLGAVTADTVVSSPKKSKAIGYAVGVFVVLLIVILLLDNLLLGVRRRRQEAVVPMASAEQDD